MKPRSYAAGLAALGGFGIALWQLWATVPTVILVPTAIGVGILMALIMSVAFPLVQRAGLQTRRVTGSADAGSRQQDQRQCEAESPPEPEKGRPGSSPLISIFGQPSPYDAGERSSA